MTDEEWGEYMTATMRAEDIAEPDYDPDYDLPEHEPEPQGTPDVLGQVSADVKDDISGHLTEGSAATTGVTTVVAAPGQPSPGAALALALKTQEILARTAHHAERTQELSGEDASAHFRESTKIGEDVHTMDTPGAVRAARYDAVQDRYVEYDPNAPEEPAEPPARNTWEPEDITDVLDGNRPPVEAELGRREDGIPILYRGKEHSIAGEPESGKTWFALMIVAQELKRGRRVTYIDFEDDAGTVVGRLLALGVLKERLRAHANQFRYVRPETKPNRDDIVNAVTFGEDQHADVVVYDGITEGATLLGLDVTGGDGQHAVAEFRRKLIRPALTLNCAVLTTDHVVKAPENRGRYAIGAQHKLAGLTGAMFMVEVVDTWGRGKRGRSRILVTKDRNAHLRQNCLPGDKPNVSYFGDLVGDGANDDGLITVRLFAPSERQEGEDGDDGQPATRYRKFVDPILKAVDASPTPMSTNAIVTSISGNKSDITATLEWLITHGRIVRELHGRGYGHTTPPPETTGSGPGPTESETQ